MPKPSQLSESCNGSSDLVDVGLTLVLAARFTAEVLGSDSDLGGRKTSSESCETFGYDASKVSLPDSDDVEWTLVFAETKGWNRKKKVLRLKPAQHQFPSDYQEFS